MHAARAQVLVLVHVLVYAARALTAGFLYMLHVHSVASLCSWEKVIQVLDKKTGSAKKVPFVRVGQTCDLEIEVPEAICVETYKDFPQLGRFVLREDGTDHQSLTPSIPGLAPCPRDASAPSCSEFPRPSLLVVFPCSCFQVQPWESA